MPLINFEISRDLTWSEDCVIGLSATEKTKFSITYTKLYVPVETIRLINWNKYQSTLEKLPQCRYLNYLIDPSFQGVNRLFVLSFENAKDRTVDKKYIPNMEIKDYNVFDDGRNFFNQPIKNDLKTCDNIRKIATGQGDDYTTSCLLDYPYFKGILQINCNILK